MKYLPNKWWKKSLDFAFWHGDALSSDTTGPKPDHDDGGAIVAETLIKSQFSYNSVYFNDN